MENVNRIWSQKYASFHTLKKKKFTKINYNSLYYEIGKMKNYINEF